MKNILYAFLFAGTLGIASIENVKALTWISQGGWGSGNMGCNSSGLPSGCPATGGVCGTLNQIRTFNNFACDYGPGEYLDCEYKCLF